MSVTATAEIYERGDSPTPPPMVSVEVEIAQYTTPDEGIPASSAHTPASPQDAADTPPQDAADTPPQDAADTPPQDAADTPLQDAANVSIDVTVPIAEIQLLSLGPCNTYGGIQYPQTWDGTEIANEVKQNRFTYWEGKRGTVTKVVPVNAEQFLVGLLVDFRTGITVHRNPLPPRNGKPRSRPPSKKKRTGSAPKPPPKAPEEFKVLWTGLALKTVTTLQNEGQLPAVDLVATPIDTCDAKKSAKPPLELEFRNSPKRPPTSRVPTPKTASKGSKIEAFELHLDSLQKLTTPQNREEHSEWAWSRVESLFPEGTRDREAAESIARKYFPCSRQSKPRLTPDARMNPSLKRSAGVVVKDFLLAAVPKAMQARLVALVREMKSSHIEQGRLSSVLKLAPDHQLTKEQVLDNLLAVDWSVQGNFRPIIALKTIKEAIATRGESDQVAESDSQQVTGSVPSDDPQQAPTHTSDAPATTQTVPSSAQPPVSDTQTVLSSAQPAASDTRKRPASSSGKGKGRRNTKRKT